MTKRSIGDWIRSAVLDGGHARFDDLHIDQIDARFRNPASWVPASIEALNEASRIRDQNGWRFTIALAIPLSSSKQSGEARPGTIQDVVAILGETPPSLYAFEHGAEPWAKSDGGFDELPGMMNGGQGAIAYLSERFDPEEGVYERNVWVAR